MDLRRFPHVERGLGDVLSARKNGVHRTFARLEACRSHRGSSCRAEQLGLRAPRGAAPPSAGQWKHAEPDHPLRDRDVPASARRNAPCRSHAARQASLSAMPMSSSSTRAGGSREHTCPSGRLRGLGGPARGRALGRVVGVHVDDPWVCVDFSWAHGAPILVACEFAYCRVRMCLSVGGRSERTHTACVSYEDGRPTHADDEYPRLRRRRTALRRPRLGSTTRTHCSRAPTAPRRTLTFASSASSGASTARSTTAQRTSPQPRSRTGVR